jgi:hypothetical protein
VFGESTLSQKERKSKIYVRRQIFFKIIISFHFYCVKTRTKKLPFLYFLFSSLLCLEFFSQTSSFFKMIYCCEDILLKKSAKEKEKVKNINSERDLFL